MKALASLGLAIALSTGIVYGQASHTATGTVTKIDRDKVTIKHGPVASLNWPSMTMAFRVKDKALLDKAKPGANVEFTFVQSGRDYVITEVK